MINIKKLSIIGLILLVVGAVGSIITFNSFNKSVSVDEEKVIQDRAIKSIEIDSDNERVEVVPSDDSQTIVQLSGRSTENVDEQLTVDVKGDTLSVQLRDKKLFNFFNFIGTDLTLTVYLPEKAYKLLKVNIDNGTFAANQLEIKAVKARTNNGHIQLENIEAKMVDVESDNGEISLENVTGEINGKVNNGKIYLETNNPDRPIALESDNGSIKIKTDNVPTNATFNVDVDNGHINIFDKYSGNAVFGNGENVISLKTNNGKITVTK